MQQETEKVIRISRIPAWSDFNAEERGLFWKNNATKDIY